MKLEELKEIMRTDPQRYQAIMRSAQAGGALSGGAFQGRTDRVYDPDVFDDSDNYQYGSYLTPKFASEQMNGYKPTNNGRGPTAMDFNNYDNHPEQEPLSEEEWNAPNEEEIAKAKRIETIKSMIADAEKRIAENTAALRDGDYEDVNNKLGQLEMDKIGFRFNRQPTNTDPTSFWRWNQARVDTKEANDLRKEEAITKFANTVDMWVNTRPAPTTEGIVQQISNINSAIRDGNNVGADVSRLVAKKEELEKLVYGGNTGNSTDYGVGTEEEQKAGELETVLATAKTSKELIEFRNRYKWKPEQLTKLDTKIAELKKKEKADADENEFRAWVEKQVGKKFSTISKRVISTYRNVWKNTRGK